MLFLFRAVSHYESNCIPLVLFLFRTFSHYENHLFSLILFLFRTVSHYETYHISLMLFLFRAVSHYESNCIPLVLVLFSTVFVENDLFMVHMLIIFHKSKTRIANVCIVNSNFASEASEKILAIFDPETCENTAVFPCFGYISHRFAL